MVRLAIIRVPRCTELPKVRGLLGNNIPSGFGCWGRVGSATPYVKRRTAKCVVPESRLVCSMFVFLQKLNVIQWFEALGFIYLFFLCTHQEDSNELDQFMNTTITSEWKMTSDVQSQIGIKVLQDRCSSGVCSIQHSGVYPVTKL